MIVDGGELVITFQLLPFNGQFSIKKMKVAVVKYNAGNIRSVDYALKRLGVEAVITADEAVLRVADKVIFPGVGEAETTMDFLRAGGMDRLIKELRQPVLGICLGMQLMCRRLHQQQERHGSLLLKHQGLEKSDRLRSIKLP